MNCIKCGKKTKGEQVFCDGCLEAMEAYPVKPDVHIQLPSHASPSTPKKAGKKRRNPTAEERISNLRRTVAWMSAVIVILTALLTAACIMLFQHIGGQETSSVGKNYTYDSNFG